jgi:hypothetical protein
LSDSILYPIILLVNYELYGICLPRRQRRHRQRQVEQDAQRPGRDGPFTAQRGPFLNGLTRLQSFQGQSSFLHRSFSLQQQKRASPQMLFFELYVSAG